MFLWKMLLIFVGGSLMICCIMFLSPFQDTPVLSERSLKLSLYLFQIVVALYFEPFWKLEYVAGINFWRLIKLND